METYKELKSFCDKKIKEFPQYEARYKKEIVMAKRYYDNERNLYVELHEKPIKNEYVIPFLLGITSKVSEKKYKMVQVKKGATGGVDVDSDFSPQTKEKVTEYLIEKFGEDRVISVGTLSRLGPASAAKDLLRIYKVGFKESNAFTSELEKTETWEQNLIRIKQTNLAAYSTYEKYKDILDLVPEFIDKVRQGGKHAGGVVVLDRPIYSLIPVERISGNLATAFPESGQDQILDELGIVKFDILGISILDVIANAIELIDEKLYLIEDNDGIKKIVSEGYIDNETQKF